MINHTAVCTYPPCGQWCPHAMLTTSMDGRSSSFEVGTVVVVTADEGDDDGDDAVGRRRRWRCYIREHRGVVSVAASFLQ